MQLLYSDRNGLLLKLRMMNKKLFLLGMVLLTLCACATTNTASQTSQGQPPRDPLEGVNRVVFGFNSIFDTYLLKPVTKGYRYITPNVVERRVSSLFSNLLEIRNTVNGLLQGKGGKSATYAGRFLINSTLGLAGLFDVADSMGLKKTAGEDFGQTLGAWGVGSGPYVVLPFLGPSNLRDSLSLPVDSYLDPVMSIDHIPTRNQTIALRTVDTRAQLLATENLVSGDRYVFIRDAYLQRRQYLVKDGVVEDTFGNGLDSEFGEDGEFKD